MAKMGKPRKYKNVEELQKGIDAYFKECDDKGEPYTVTGLALTLDIDRSTLLRYEKEFEEEYRVTVKNAKTKIENNIEKFSMMGKYNPTMSIFNLKNNFGWKDKYETDQTIKAEVVELTLEQKEQRLKDLKERLDEVYGD